MVKARRVERPRDEPAAGGVNLAAADLNLLVLFEALWVERSVTGAGRRVGLSQPAASGGLARLRLMLGDRLFVRGKSGLEPTPRCSELAGPLTRTLVELRNVIAGASFDPTTSTRQIRLGAVDAAIAVVMPEVLRRTMQQAPGLKVQVVSIDPSRATDLLEAGQLDLALSPRPGPSATVRSRPLYPLELVVAARRGYPLGLAKASPARSDLERFPRVQVGFQGAASADAAVVVSSFLAVPPLLAASEAWALLPRPYARLLSASRMLDVSPLPAGFSVQPMRMQLLWPEAQHEAPVSRWFRGLIADVAASLREA